jgi:hypothetical protein
LLESIVLAMEGTPKAYSYGRGNITPEAIEAIVTLAASHGIEPAPLFHPEAIRNTKAQTAPNGHIEKRTGATLATDLYP